MVYWSDPQIVSESIRDIFSMLAWCAALLNSRAGHKKIFGDYFLLGPAEETS